MDVQAWATRHVDLSLKYWEANATRHDVVASYVAALSMLGASTPNADKLALVQLTGEEMRVHSGPRGPDDFMQNVLAYLASAFRSLRTKGWATNDMFFIISSHDSMNQYPPRFSQSFPIFTGCMRTRGKCADSGIMLPWTYKIFDGDQPMSSSATGQLSWERKRGVAIFRGALSGPSRLPLFARARLSNVTDIACTLLPDGAPIPAGRESGSMCRAADYAADESGVAFHGATRTTPPPTRSCASHSDSWGFHAPRKWVEQCNLPTNCSVLDSS